MTQRRAKKRFGQHFLEPAWVKKVLHAIAPLPTDTFLEIGPGRGALTRPLARAAAGVFAYEIDRDLAADLAAGAPANMAIIEGDFLEITASQLSEVGPCRAAGNLPYNVAAPILFKLRDLYAEGIPIVDATVMMQREVADRLLAPPGGGEYGVLSVLMRLWADVDRLLSLPPGAFRPVPKVHSTLVRLQFHPPDPAPADPVVFERLVASIFTRRRKMLANALLAFDGSTRLSPREALRVAGMDGRRRPETLAIPELVTLADVFGRAML